MRDGGATSNLPSAPGAATPGVPTANVSGGSRNTATPNPKPTGTGYIVTAPASGGSFYYTPGTKPLFLPSYMLLRRPNLQK
ncbi:hypothetical protein U1Q18_048761, partial [Sarracenia purpurea var. burkii]